MVRILLGMALLIAATGACGGASDGADPSAGDRTQPGASPTTEQQTEQRLAFVSNREGPYYLYTMDPDGGDVRRVSDRQVAPYPFSVSRDGTQIVAWEGQDPVSEKASPRVYRVDVVGGESELLGDVPLPGDSLLIMAARWQKDDDSVLAYVHPHGVCYSLPSGGGDVREESPEKCIEGIVVGEGPGESIAAIVGVSLVMTEARNTEGRVLDQIIALESEGEGEEGAGWALVGLGAMQAIGLLRPVWSPDGESIAYVDLDADDGQGGIAVISAEGGDSRVLVPWDEDSEDTLFPRAWSSDGKRVIFAGMEEATAIQDVSLDGRDVRTLVGDDGFEYLYPQWVAMAPAPDRPLTPSSREEEAAALRDALKLACGYLMYEEPYGPLFSTAPDGSGARMINPNPPYPISLSADGSLIAYGRRIQGEGRTALILFDVERQEERELDDGARPSLAPSGRMLAYWSCSRQASNDDETCGLVVMDLKTGEQRELHRGKQLYMVQPAWSPDENRIAFFAQTWQGHDTDTLQVDLTVVDVRSGVSTVIAELGESRPESPAAWSPDGSQIAFADNQLHLAELDGSGVRDFPLEAESAAWSPSGDRLAVRDFELVALLEPVSGEITWLTSDVGGVVSVPPAWSPDGRLLAYASSRDELMVVDVATRVTVTVLPNANEPRWIGFGCTSP